MEKLRKYKKQLSISLHVCRTVHSPKTTYMNHLVTTVFFLFSFIGLSQQDMFVVTTDISVDSIYYMDHKLNHLIESDSVLSMKAERNHDTVARDLTIYSNQKTYQVSIPANLTEVFEAEWVKRDPKNPISILMTIKKGDCVFFKADGSAVNMMSSLIVLDSKGEWIEDECCGVYQAKKTLKGKR